MVKWAPFASLKEQSIYLNKLKVDRQKVERPLLSEDEINAINEKLVNYDGETLVITYYDHGFIKQFESVISKIDVPNKKVITPDLVISFDDLIKLND